MGVVHDASEHLWTRPFKTKATPFLIVMAPVTRVPRALLGLHAFITWVMLSVGLRFRLGSRSEQVRSSLGGPLSLGLEGGGWGQNCNTPGVAVATAIPLQCCDSAFAMFLHCLLQ
jgi:hypothetical protein